MIQSHLKLIDAEGKKIEVAFESIMSMQAYYGVTPIEVGNMSIAGSGSHYVLLTTTSGSHKIPRRPENDSELLTFTLSKKI